MENVSHFDYFGVTRVASSPWQPHIRIIKVSQHLAFSKTNTVNNVNKLAFSKFQFKNLLRKRYIFLKEK